MIFFVGSVFSPWYAWARRRGATDPLQHCAAHVVLFGPRARWAMTERSAGAVTRTTDHLTIGPSDMRWHDDGLTVTLRERGCPLPRAVRGTVRVRPAALTGARFALDAAGRHVWQPLAPRAHVEVRLQQPALQWSGDGYLDHNAGVRPMEDDFVRWDWSRAALGNGAALYYDVSRRDGSRHLVARRMAADGTLTPLPEPPIATLPRTRWGVARETRGQGARVVRTLLDAPFYARSVVTMQVGGETVEAMHESLSLERFTRPWVQAMLPFRVPRRT